jgi:hypothetical protein
VADNAPEARRGSTVLPTPCAIFRVGIGSVFIFTFMRDEDDTDDDVDG